MTRLTSLTNSILTGSRLKFAVQSYGGVAYIEQDELGQVSIVVNKSPTDAIYTGMQSLGIGSTFQWLSPITPTAYQPYPATLTALVEDAGSIYRFRISTVPNPLGGDYPGPASYGFFLEYIFI